MFQFLIRLVSLSNSIYSEARIWKHCPFLLWKMRGTQLALLWELIWYDKTLVPLDRFFLCHSELLYACGCVISFYLLPCQLSPSDLSLGFPSVPLFSRFLIVFFCFAFRGRLLSCICSAVLWTNACCQLFFFPCPLSVGFLPNTGSEGTLHLITFQLTKSNVYYAD